MNYKMFTEEDRKLPFKLGEDICSPEFHVRYVISDSGRRLMFHDQVVENETGITIHIERNLEMKKNGKPNPLIWAYRKKKSRYLNLKIVNLGLVKRNHYRKDATGKRVFSHSEDYEGGKATFDSLPRYITLNCPNPDEYGFCMGHIMPREQFISHYCGGVEPPELQDAVLGNVDLALLRKALASIMEGK